MIVEKVVDDAYILAVRSEEVEVIAYALMAMGPKAIIKVTELDDNEKKIVNEMRDKLIEFCGDRH